MQKTKAERLQPDYPKRIPVSREHHDAILVLHESTGKPIYLVARELIDLALKVKRIPIRGDVS